MRTLPVSAVASAFLVGCAVAGTATYSPPRWFSPALISGGALLYLSSPARYLRATVILVFATWIGYSYTAHWRTSRRVSLPERTVTLSGTIIAPPDTRDQSILLTVATCLPQPSEEARCTRLLVTVPRYPVYQYGDQLTFTGTVTAPEPFNGFDYPRYLERFGIQGRVLDARKVTVQRPNAGNPGLAFLYRLRGKVERWINRTLPEPEASFLAGILLGSRRSIPEDLQESLRVTGTSHLVAVSGANITIVITILLRLLPLRGQLTRLLAIGTFGSAVALLTGASASVVRGATIAVAGAYLRFRGRRAWPTPLLTVSMAILVANNPLLISADPGFQLSFAAFAGLLYFGTYLSEWIEHWPLTARLPAVIQQAIAETTAATLGTLPLTLVLFGTVNPLSLVVNPLVLWLLPLTTSLGLLLAGFGWLPYVQTVLRLPLWLLLHTMLSTISRFAQVTATQFHIGASWRTALLGFLALAGIAAHLQRQRFRWQPS